MIHANIKGFTKLYSVCTYHIHARPCQSRPTQACALDLGGKTQRISARIHSIYGCCGRPTIPLYPAAAPVAGTPFHHVEGVAARACACNERQEQINAETKTDAAGCVLCSLSSAGLPTSRGTRSRVFLRVLSTDAKRYTALCT